MTELAHFDIVGSFLRPEELKQARDKFNHGDISQAELTQVENQEIEKLIHTEENLGLKAVTDGEFRRSWWHLDFLWGLTGVKKYDYHESYKFHGAKTRTDNAELAGKVAYNPEHPFFKAFEFVKEHTNVTPKQTIPSPTLLFRDNRSDNWPNFYNNKRAYLDDLAKAYHETIKHFYDLGCRSLENLPDDLTVATHICRGNFKSTFLFSGGYEPIAKYLAQLNYDRFFLEYDNDRAGDFAPIKTIWNNRDDVTIVLGLITSKDGQLENPAAIIQRVNEAAKLVPLSNLALSTQCGFASTEEGNILSEADQWKKIKLVVDTANKIWK